jgi:hypothetical protein
MMDTPLQLPETAPLTGPELAAQRMERLEMTVIALATEVDRLKELLAPPTPHPPILGACIYRRDDGQLTVMPVQLRYCQPTAPAPAAAKLRAGQAVFVAREVAEQVIAAACR